MVNAIFQKKGIVNVNTIWMNEIHFLLFIWRRKSKCAAILKLVMHCWHGFVIFLHGRPPLCTADSCEAANLMSKICLFEQQTNKKWMKTKNFQMLLIATNLPICECIEPSTIGTPICTADSCEAATDFANLIFEDQMLLSWKRKETVIFKDWRWNENILSVDL